MPVGALFFLMATLAAPSPQVAIRPPGNKGQGNTPIQVADTLDTIFQARFSVASSARRGASNIIAGHPNVDSSPGGVLAGKLRTTNPEETRTLRKVSSGDSDFLVAFMHIAHAPGAGAPAKPAENPPRISALAVKGTDSPAIAKDQASHTGQSEDGMSRIAEIQKLGMAVLKRLKAGQKLNIPTQQGLLAMRPVNATQDSCIKCHVGVKKGEALGVMVYVMGSPASMGKRP